jgi:hypothetical protein
MDNRWKNKELIATWKTQKTKWHIVFSVGSLAQEKKLMILILDSQDSQSHPEVATMNHLVANI